jgi:hypothetical protein
MLVRTNLLYILMLIMLHGVDIYAVWYTAKKSVSCCMHTN